MKDNVAGWKDVVLGWSRLFKSDGIIPMVLGKIMNLADEAKESLCFCVKSFG